MSHGLLQAALQNKIVWYLGTRYLTFAVQLLSSIYIAVKLGVRYWGIWSFILLTVNIGYQLNWGIGSSTMILMVQNKGDDKLNRSICYNSFILTIFGMIPAILFVFYERLFKIPLFIKYQTGSMIYGALFVICLYHLNILLMNISRTRNHVFPIAFNQSVFPVICFILMFFFKGERLLHLLLCGYVVAMLASVVIYIKNGYIRLSEKVDLSLCCTILKKGWLLFLYNACFVLIVLTTKMLVSYYYSVAAFGLFAFAFNLASAALLFVDSVTFIAQAKMIDMLQGNDPKTNLKRIEFIRQCYLISITGIICLAIPAFYLLIQFIPKYKDSFSSFVLIILSLELYPICYGYNAYLMAHNKEKIMACLAGLAMLLNAAITWFLASYLHVQIEYCLAGIMVAYLLYVFAVNLITEKTIFSSWQFKNILRYIPPYMLVSFVLTFFLQHMQSLHILWIPFAVFFAFGYRNIISFVRNVRFFISKSDAMDVKQSQVR